MTTNVKEMAQAGVAKAAAVTAVQTQNTVADKFEELVKDLIPKLSKASLAKTPPEFIISTLMTVLRGSPQLKACEPMSLIHCTLQSAQVGLRLDPVLQHAALVPRGGKAQFMPMFRGLLHLARQSGEIVHVAAQPVCSNDFFEYEYGVDQRLVHRPALAKRGDVTHYYAYVRLKSGGFQFEVITLEDAEDMKRFAQAKISNKADNPWTTDFDAMALKTVLRKLLKLAPIGINPAFSAALQADEMLDRGVDQAHVITTEGLVVPSGYGEAEVVEEPAKVLGVVKDAEQKTEAGVAKAPAEVKEAKPTPKTDVPTESSWMNMAQSALEALHKKGDVESVESARGWAREAIKRNSEGNLSEASFTAFKTFYRGLFPAPEQKPEIAPTMEMFTDKGEPIVPVDPPKPEPKPKKPAKKAEPKGDDPNSDTLRDKFLGEIEESEKFAVLWAVKNRIEMSIGINESDMTALKSALDKKIAKLKAK
jgi:recombination protein RecT